MKKKIKNKIFILIGVVCKCAKSKRNAVWVWLGRGICEIERVK